MSAPPTAPTNQTKKNINNDKDSKKKEKKEDRSPGQIPSAKDLSSVLDAVLKQGLETNGYPRRTLVSAAEVATLSLKTKDVYRKSFRGPWNEEDSELPPETEESKEQLKRFSTFCNMLTKGVHRHRSTKTYFSNVLYEMTGFKVFPFFTGGDYDASALGLAQVQQFYLESVVPAERAAGNYSDEGHLFLQYPMVLETPAPLKLFFDCVPPPAMTSNAIVTSYLALGAELCDMDDSKGEFYKSFYSAFCHVTFGRAKNAGTTATDADPSIRGKLATVLGGAVVPDSVRHFCWHSHDRMRDRVGSEAFKAITTSLVEQITKDVDVIDDVQRGWISGSRAYRQELVERISINYEPFAFDGNLEAATDAGTPTSKHQDFCNPDLEGMYAYHFLLHLSLIEELKDIEEETVRSISTDLRSSNFTGDLDLESVKRGEMVPPATLSPSAALPSSTVVTDAPLFFDETVLAVRKLYETSDSWKPLLVHLKSKDLFRLGGLDEANRAPLLRRMEKSFKVGVLKTVDRLGEWLMCIMNRSPKAVSKVLAETNLRFFEKRYGKCWGKPEDFVVGTDSMAGQRPKPWSMSLSRCYELVAGTVYAEMNSSIHPILAPVDGGSSGGVDDPKKTDDGESGLPFQPLRDLVSSAYVYEETNYPSRPVNRDFHRSPLLKTTPNFWGDSYEKAYFIDLGLDGGNFEGFLTECGKEVEKYFLWELEKKNERPKFVASEAPSTPLSSECGLYAQKSEFEKGNTFVQLYHPYYYTLNTCVIFGAAQFDHRLLDVFRTRLEEPNFAWEKEKLLLDSDDPSEAVEDAARVWNNIATKGYLHLRVEDHDKYVTFVHSVLLETFEEKRRHQVQLLSDRSEGAVDWFSVSPVDPAGDVERQRCFWFEATDWLHRFVSYLVSTLEKVSVGGEFRESATKVLSPDQLSWIEEVLQNCPKPAKECSCAGASPQFPEKCRRFRHWLMASVAEKNFYASALGVKLPEVQKLQEEEESELK
jgi:hypothetical protein